MRRRSGPTLWRRVAPYRFVRNPLYLGNILMVTGMGTLMSRFGFVFAVLAMVGFCYRLILREEGELQLIQAAQYIGYLHTVPRLIPAYEPRVIASEQRPNWKAGFLAEFWFWGFAIALATFAITLQIKWFFIVTAASVALLWASSVAIQRRP